MAPKSPRERSRSRSSVSGSFWPCSSSRSCAPNASCRRGSGARSCSWASGCCSRAGSSSASRPGAECRDRIGWRPMLDRSSRRASRRRNGRSRTSGPTTNSCPIGRIGALLATYGRQHPISTVGDRVDLEGCVLRHAIHGGGTPAAFGAGAGLPGHAHPARRPAAAQRGAGGGRGGGEGAAGAGRRRPAGHRRARPPAGRAATWCWRAPTARPGATRSWWPSAGRPAPATWGWTPSGWSRVPTSTSTPRCRSTASRGSTASGTSTAAGSSRTWASTRRVRPVRRSSPAPRGRTSTPRTGRRSWPPPTSTRRRRSSSPSRRSPAWAAPRPRRRRPASPHRVVEIPLGGRRLPPVRRRVRRDGDRGRRHRPRGAAGRHVRRARRRRAAAGRDHRRRRRGADPAALARGPRLPDGQRDLAAAAREVPGLTCAAW